MKSEAHRRASFSTGAAPSASGHPTEFDVLPGGSAPVVVAGRPGGAGRVTASPAAGALAAASARAGQQKGALGRKFGRFHDFAGRARAGGADRRVALLERHVRTFPLA